MNETIELRHSPYMNEWLIVGGANQPSFEITVTPPETRNLVSSEELGQFSQEPTIVFEMN